MGGSTPDSLWDARVVASSLKTATRDWTIIRTTIDVDLGRDTSTEADWRQDILAEGQLRRDIFLRDILPRDQF